MSNPMIRPKREFKCSICGLKYIKWQGMCTGCGKSATIEKIDLVPERTRTLQSSSAKRLQRRAKDSERNIGKRMLQADGADPSYRNISSSTGRVGHITSMRFDTVSRTYITENKNRKLPSWLIKAWVLINQRGDDLQKNILLHIDPPNMPRTYLSLGVTKKLDTMAILKQERHAELIQAERLLNNITKIIFSDKQYKSLQEMYEEEYNRIKEAE